MPKPNINTWQILMRNKMQRAFKQISRITDDNKTRSINSIVRVSSALLGQKRTKEKRIANLKKCPFYQTPGSPNNCDSTGCCNFNRETRCCGDFQSCKELDALKTYLSEQGLAWRNERRTERVKSLWKRTKRESSADLISQSIVEYIHGLSKLLLITVSFAITIFLGMFNRLTGPETSSYVFYLIPISLVTWFTQKWIGLVMSVVCALTWLIADTSAKTPLSFSAIPFWNAIPRMGSFLIFTCILGAVREVLEREKNSSRTDPLTGARNRKCFIELTELEILRTQRNTSFFTVVYIDLDNFKSVNDRFGHIVGDKLLRLVSKTIQKNIRETDTVARLGGDEFAILLPDTGSELAELIIRRIQKNSSDMMQKHEWPVTFSIGAATFASPSLTVDEVLKKSDDLMYNAKKAGKNTVRQEVFANEVQPQISAV